MSEAGLCKLIRDLLLENIISLRWCSFCGIVCFSSMKVLQHVQESIAQDEGETRNTPEPEITCTTEHPSASDSGEGPITMETTATTSERIDQNDVGTQCCVGARYRITRTVSTETEAKTFSDIGIQVNIEPPDNHTEANTPDNCSEVSAKKTKADNEAKPTNKPKLTLYEQVYPSDEEPVSSPLPDNDDDKDYVLSDKERSDSEGNSDDDRELQATDEQNLLVFGSCLKKLLKFCPKCGGVILELKETTCGSMLSVKIQCINDHDDYCWTSQPVIRNIAAGNLLTSAAILFSGKTFSRIAQFASFLKLKFFSHTTYYNLQNKFLFPVVNKAWTEERSSVLDDIKQKGPVNLIGDGRCDSPGHNAKYCTYTMMTDEGKVAYFSLVQVTEATSSNAMEKEGFERCIAGLQAEDVTIKRIATDRHTSISSAMNKDHKDIQHQFDVWHLSKWVVKQLTKKAKVKGCENLFPWIKSVSNHLWWCSATCDGNAGVLREKWKSIMYHVTNKHKWRGNTHFHECCHPALTNAEARKKKWLKPDTPTYIALEEVMLNKKLLKDIEKLTEFCHTGEVEVYHSEQLKYCPKREHFSHKGMTARTQLTALDHNANAGRKQAVVQTGEHSGEARYKVSFSKAQKQWAVKPIKEKKSYAQVERLMDDVVTACQIGRVEPELEELNLPKNISGTAAPSKQELVQAHRSRFH